jgi:hypothetical protein
LKPAFVFGYAGRPQLVNPAYTNSAMISPLFNGVDVREVQKCIAEDYKQIIISAELYLLEPGIREYQLPGYAVMQSPAQQA